MKVCSTENMQIAERELIVSGTPARTLMKLASSGIAESLMQFFPDPGLCVAYVGKGNNGGDALTILNILKPAVIHPPYGGRNGIHNSLKVIFEILGLNKDNFYMQLK